MQDYDAVQKQASKCGGIDGGVSWQNVDHLGEAIHDSEDSIETAGSTAMRSMLMSSQRWVGTGERVVIRTVAGCWVWLTYVTSPDVFPGGNCDVRPVEAAGQLIDCFVVS